MYRTCHGSKKDCETLYYTCVVSKLTSLIRVLLSNTTKRSCFHSLYRMSITKTDLIVFSGHKLKIRTRPDEYQSVDYIILFLKKDFITGNDFIHSDSLTCSLFKIMSITECNTERFIHQLCGVSGQTDRQTSPTACVHGQ